MLVYAHDRVRMQVSLQCDTRGPSSILGRIADVADEADTETGVTEGGSEGEGERGWLCHSL